MQKRAKNEVFGRFIEFGACKWSDIAYSNRYKWYSSTIGNQDVGMGHSLGLIRLIYARKSQKWGFWPFYRVWLVSMADTIYSDQ